MGWIFVEDSKYILSTIVTNRDNTINSVFRKPMAFIYYGAKEIRINREGVISETLLFLLKFFYFILNSSWTAIALCFIPIFLIYIIFLLIIWKLQLIRIHLPNLPGPSDPCDLPQNKRKRHTKKNLSSPVCLHIFSVNHRQTHSGQSLK